VIQASSAQSVPGTITAPNTEFSDSLVVLPEIFLDASSQLREACAVRGGRPISSLTRRGRGGLQPDPGAPLTSTADTRKDDRRVKPMTSHPARPHPSNSGSVQVSQAISPPGPPVFGCGGGTGR